MSVAEQVQEETSWRETASPVQSVTDRGCMLRMISDLLGVPLLILQDGRVRESMHAELLADSTGAFRSPKIRSLVRDISLQAAGQLFPVIRLDACGVFWFCIPEAHTGLLIAGGPLTISPTDSAVLQHFCRYYSLEAGKTAIPYVRLQQFLSMVRLLDMVLNGRETSESDLICRNRLTGDFPVRTGQTTEGETPDTDEEMRAHHSYQEEQALQESIRTGNTAEALTRSIALMDTAGRMGTDPQSHWYNLAVSAITLSTRSAIEGGLSPAEAYRLSDFYIRRLHYGDSIVDIRSLVNSSVIDLTDRVAKLRKGDNPGYVEACKDYINAHYREKIRISDAAGVLGISEGYLSRIFHRAEGQTFQTYLLSFRLERAANLLKYSDASIGEISSYCCFPSQSYFSDRFKRYTDLSPGEYRKKYQTAAFRTQV